MSFSHPSGEPRERFPSLADVLTDLAIADWHDRGVCLCGCEQRTKYVKGHPGDLIHYFVNGHAQLLKAAHGRAKGSPRTAQVRQAVRKKNLAACIDGRYIIAAVREHIDTHYAGNITAFCREHDLQHSSLCYNLNRGVTMITKSRARQLLLAIGEQPHASLA